MVLHFACGRPRICRICPPGVVRTWDSRTPQQVWIEKDRAFMSLDKSDINQGTIVAHMESIGFTPYDPALQVPEGL